MLYSNAKIINKVLDEGEAKPLNSAANDEGIFIVRYFIIMHVYKR
jgi:hypothetical protein